MTEWAFYRDGRRQPDLSYDDAVAAARSGSGFVWVALHEPDEPTLDAAAADFGLHPLAVEDATDAQESPKLSLYDHAVVMVMRTVGYVSTRDGVPRGEVVDTGRLTAFVGTGFAITVSHSTPDVALAIRQRLEDQPKLLAHGPSAVLHTAADVIVDDYLDAADRFEADLAEIEAAVFADESGNQAERIYRAKRELLKLRKSIMPLGQPVRTLAQRTLDPIPGATQEYFRDVNDHLDRVHRQLTGFDEIINSMLQANLAQLSVAQNNDMRKITSWAALIAVPTAIAGIYGMNFADMPELHWSLGYPAVLLLMASLCVVLYWNFKRRGWL